MWKYLCGLFLPSKVWYGKVCFKSFYYEDITWHDKQKKLVLISDIVIVGCIAKESIVLMPLGKMIYRINIEILSPSRPSSVYEMRITSGYNILLSIYLYLSLSPFMTSVDICKATRSFHVIVKLQIWAFRNLYAFFLLCLEIFLLVKVNGTTARYGNIEKANVLW